MGAKKNLIGQRFGRLVVIKESPIRTTNGQVCWVCQCDCGNTVEVRSGNLQSGNTSGCGCGRVGNKNARKYGFEVPKRLVHIYSAMKHRCNNPNNNGYQNYGGRGIKVCKEWNDNAEMFYRWALANGYSGETSLDRIDVNGGYSPENCRWATQKTQANNRRNNRAVEINGTVKTISEWADFAGLPYSLVADRVIKKKWAGERILEPPKRSNQHG